VLILDYSLLDCRILPYEGFMNGSEMIERTEFQVYNMELYLLK
jgi:hypothetical protein